MYHIHYITKIMASKTVIDKHLQEIIKNVAESETYNVNENMSTIQQKQCTTLEFYLLAMVQRLEV